MTAATNKDDELIALLAIAECGFRTRGEQASDFLLTNSDCTAHAQLLRDTIDRLREQIAIAATWNGQSMLC